MENRNIHFMHNRYSITILIIVISLTSFSCNGLFRKDRSLTIKEYRAKGMPDISKAWSEQDLVKAHIALGSVRARNFLALPIKGSRKSGAVFSRMTSMENLDYLKDSTIALHDMAYHIQTISTFLSDLARMYTDNLKKEQYYSNELIAIYIYEIRVRENMLDLAFRILKSSDPADMAMQSGHQAILNGYASLMELLLKNDEKPEAFTTGQLKMIDREIAGSVINNAKYLDPGNKKRISTAISNLMKKSDSAWIKKNFKKCLEDLAEE